MSKFNIAKAYGNLINEYKKVYRPNRTEVYHVTVIVILMTIFVALYTLFFDIAFDAVLVRLTALLKRFLGGA